MRRLALAALFALAAPAVHGQPVLGWDVLEAAQIVEARGGGWAVRHARAVVDLEGERVELSGHMIPLEAGRRTSRFAVSRMTAEQCFYCQPGPMSLVEVHTDRPVTLTRENVTVVGTLALPARGQRYTGGTVYRLDDARVTRAGLR